MGRTDVLREHFELLIELEDIGEALAAVERRHGLHELIEAARLRQQRAHGNVAARLRALLDYDEAQVH